MSGNPMTSYALATKALAEALPAKTVYEWLVDHGYYPEAYVLPPSFRVARRAEGSHVALQASEEQASTPTGTRSMRQCAPRSISRTPP